MSLALDHIPCPAGNSCTAFKCIFGHPGKNPRTAVEQGAKADRSKSGDAPEPSTPRQDGPRKRLKVDSTPTLAGRPANADGDQQAASNLRTLQRRVSPPPVQRPTPSSGKGNPFTASFSSNSAKPAVKPVTPSPGAREPPKPPKKAETLNPRLLKGSPASHELRIKLLRMLHQEFQRLNSGLRKDANDEELKLLWSDQELIIRALDEEQKTAVEKGAVYGNIMKNKVVQYKRMTIAQWKAERVKEQQGKQKKRRQSDISDQPKNIETGLTASQEVQLLSRLLTPINNLSKHGYVVSVPSEEALRTAREGLEAAKGWEKCDRCQQRFQVFPGRREDDGALTSGGTCNFHWGKTYVPERNPTGDRTRVPKRYQCCGQEVGDSAGCHTHNHHVYKISDPKRLGTVVNFAETPENTLAPTDRAVCFDCEMGYTVYGLELIRLTATSWPSGNELLDVLVRPVGEILDLNSRFSGVWADDLAKAETWVAGDDLKPAKSGDETGSEDGEVRSKRKLKIVSSPEIARSLLFSLISPSTPLIGHGLENDLNAVRIVHQTVIDTVLLYPHKAGLPFRYGLKMLMDTHLNRKIQQDTGPKMLGHDSAEDARAAGDLVRLKVMNEWKHMQRVGWKIVEEEFVSPGKEVVKEDGANGNLTEEFIES